jgi:hypothetical protein
MEKTVLPEKALDSKISQMSFEQFWTKGLANFHKTTEAALMEKINNIILLEMFRDPRARDIALEELFSRQQEKIQIIFEKMQKKGLIKKDIDAKVLALEYTYPMLALRFEYNILKNWNLKTTNVQKKMIDHIKFISQIAKTLKEVKDNE